MQSTRNSERARPALSEDRVARRLAPRSVVFGAAALMAVGALVGAAQLNSSTSAIAQTAAQQNTAAPVTMPSFADVIERVRGAVVSVRVTVSDAETGPGGESWWGRRGGEPRDPMEQFFRRFGGQGGPFGQQPRIRRSQGSGFVISQDGYVVTNYHVVRNATRVELRFDEGKTVTANVVGSDEKSDIALLKINEAGTYPHVEFADELPRVGDWVVAVGNPFGLGGTVTAGIVSAHGRNIGAGPYDDFLQIDAPVNRGNSGGPTFNVHGKVVGVNTAIYSPSGGSIGIGFAIPANVVRNVVDSLRETGTVSRGFIGVQVQPVTDEIAETLGLKERRGALIADTSAGLPAAQAGLRPGDVVVSVNGDPVNDPSMLARRIAAIAPGSEAKLTYIRDGRERIASVKLAELPQERQAGLPPRGASPAPAEDTRFGMMLAPADDVAGGGSEGVVIAEIDPSGLAARQGLRSGDIILEAGGQAIREPGQFTRVVAEARRAGRKAVLLRVKSAAGTRFLALNLRSSDQG